MKVVERTVQGHLQAASEIGSVISSPSIVKYRREPSAPVRIDHVNEKLAYVIDVDRCEEVAISVVEKRFGNRRTRDFILRARRTRMPRREMSSLQRRKWDLFLSESAVCLVDGGNGYRVAE